MLWPAITIAVQEDCSIKPLPQIRMDRNGAINTSLVEISTLILKDEKPLPPFARNTKKINKLLVTRIY
jgi:hypothetical protein